MNDTLIPVTLTFLREELLYDLSQYGYVEGDVMKTEDDHDRHQVQDITEEGNIDLVTRQMDLAVSMCRERLYKLTKKNIDKSEAVLDDVLEAADQYEIKLLVAPEFSGTTTEYLEQLIHNFIVFRTLYNWLSVSHPSDMTSAKNWAIKADETMEEIESAVYPKWKRIRRRTTPF